MLKTLAIRVRDRSVVLLTLNYFLGQLLYRCGLHSHKSGGTHGAMHLPESLAYIKRVFDDYLEWGGLSTADLRDKVVLEIGPGDNLGVALLFAAHGAKRVICLDRFEPDTNNARNRAIYRAIVSELDPAARARAEACVSPEGTLRGGVIEYRSNAGIEDAHRWLAPGTVDLIVSRAVLQHVSSVEAAWSSMDRLLGPRGVMLHKIDFRSHGYYESLHPLQFLAIPQWIWKWISGPDPTLNRARAAAYELLAARDKYSFQAFVTNIVSRKDEIRPHPPRLEKHTHFGDAELQVVDAIKNRLQEPFRSVPSEELLITGMFLTARKS